MITKCTECEKIIEYRLTKKEKFALGKNGKCPHCKAENIWLPSQHFFPSWINEKQGDFSNLYG